MTRDDVKRCQKCGRGEVKSNSSLSNLNRFNPWREESEESELEEEQV